MVTKLNTSSHFAASTFLLFIFDLMLVKKKVVLSDDQSRKFCIKNLIFRIFVSVLFFLDLVFEPIETPAKRKNIISFGFDCLAKNG